MNTYVALRVHREIERTLLSPEVRLEEIRISLQPLPTRFQAENANEALSLAIAHYPTFRACLMIQEESAYVRSLPALAQCRGIYEFPHPSSARPENFGRREHPYRNPRPVHQGHRGPAKRRKTRQDTPAN